MSRPSGLGLHPLTWSRSLAWGLLVLLQDPMSLEEALGRMTILGAETCCQWEGRRGHRLGCPGPSGPPQGTRPQPPKGGSTSGARAILDLGDAGVLVEGSTANSKRSWALSPAVAPAPPILLGSPILVETPHTCPSLYGGCFPTLNVSLCSLQFF